MAALMARRAAPTSWRRASSHLPPRRPGARVFVMLALRSASTHLARDLLEAEHRVGLVHQRGHGDRDEHRREGVVRELR